MAEEWPQRIIEFSHWPDAESVAVRHLNPYLASAGGDLAQWSFIRKAPAWRLRFRPHSTNVIGVDRLLNAMVAEGLVERWCPGIYEPEKTAFGGLAGINLAHELFHRDSIQVLNQLGRLHTVPGKVGLGRRELALLLPSVAMRAAGLDWYEQGDVWAKVAAQRPAPGPVRPDRLRHAAQRLMTVDTGPSSAPVADGRLTHLADWISTFEHAGQQLAHLNNSGVLHRGLRAVIAHHVIFHWNRLGLPREDQGSLSTLAKEAVMGTSDNAASSTRETTDRTSVTDMNSDTPETAPDTLRARLVDQLIEDGSVRTPRVEEAMRTVPRHLFVPEAPLEKAYANSTVDTKLDAEGRSISCASQPGIVALMLEQLDVRPGMKVLELGAGTGYNAGLLAHLVGPTGHVTSVDVDDDIVTGARTGLSAASIDNVTVVLGDGAAGHTDGAPYARIIAAVGAHAVPHAWMEQLAPGGRLLAPLRLRGSVSRSIAFERSREGLWRSVGSEMNTFMPLRRGIADDPRVFLPLDPDGHVQLVTNGDQAVDTDALSGVLGQPHTEVWTGVALRGPETTEWLELWLTCALPNGLSRMPAKQAAIDSGLLSNPYPSATATFDTKGTLAYLTRRKADHTAPDGATLYEFGVIGHGPDAEALVERFAQEIRAWGGEYRGGEASFEIQSRDTARPKSRPGRFTLDNTLGRIVVEWQ